jgi:hypothetical protein
MNWEHLLKVYEDMLQTQNEDVLLLIYEILLRM